MVGRTVVFVFFLLIFSSAVAQNHPVLYGGFEYYRNTGFENNAHYNVNFGIRLFQWKFLAPELGLNFNSGIIKEREFKEGTDPNAIPVALYQSSFNSFSVSLAPKVRFGNEEAALVIIPEYNLARIYTKGDYLVFNGNQLYGLEHQQKFSENQNYWTFAAGIEGEFLNVDHLWFSLLLKYTLLNSEQPIGTLDFSAYGFNSNAGAKDGIGLGIRVYYDLFSALR